MKSAHYPDVWVYITWGPFFWTFRFEQLWSAPELTRRPENFRISRFGKFESNEIKKIEIGQLWSDLWPEEGAPFGQKVSFLPLYWHIIDPGA